MTSILTTALVTYLFTTPVAFAVDIYRPIGWGRTDSISSIHHLHPGSPENLPSSSANGLGAKSIVPAAGIVEVTHDGTTFEVTSGQSSAIDGIGRVSSVACDGTTDVTTALNADMATYSWQGGGDYYLPPHTQCAVRPGHSPWSWSAAPANCFGGRRSARRGWG